MNAISLSNVLKRFSDGEQLHVIFEDMNFQVKEGELIAISGKEGTGKSTLLQMIAAITPPNKGTVEVFGQDIIDIKKRSDWRVQTIGFMNDESVLMPYMSIKENLLLGLSEDDPKYPARLKRAHEILHDLDFPEVEMNESIEALDDEKQILATIARILMNNPKIILADEPTKALPGERGKEVIDHLLAFAEKQGTTVIIVTEDEDLVQRADKFYHVEDRQLVEKSTESAS